MAETDDDPLLSWQERIGTLRKRGRISGAAVTVVPPVQIDVRQSRPSPPDRLSAEERELWERLTLTRRPGWFVGSEQILESYIVTVLQVQQLEAELRKTTFDTPGYSKLLRLHRQTVALASSLATKLRLVPSSKLDRRTPTDGEVPVP